MIPARTPSPFAFLPTTALLLVIGVGGLLVLFNFTVPNLFPRWLFFFLVTVAGTGLALPAVSFLNFRFPSDPPAPVRVIVRQALWVGVYAATVAWLQFGRVFNTALAVLTAVAFIFIEWVLRLRERSRWESPE